MDREADFFALFVQQRKLKRTHVLVRAKHDRSPGKDEDSLFKAMRKGKHAILVELSVSRVSRR